MSSSLHRCVPNRCKHVWSAPAIAPIAIALVLGLFGLLFAPGMLRAADTANPVEFPLFLLNIASIQKILDDSALMFDSAERTDLNSRIENWVANDLKETKGFDRTRPLGIMFYLGASLSFEPEAIFYIPVSNLEEVLATLAYEYGEVKPIEGSQNRHTIRYGESQEVETLYRDGYLFLVIKDKKTSSSSLDRNFPDPEKMASRLTAQYDISVSLMLNSLSSTLKTTFLTFFNATSKAHLQQRDDEPESTYRLRRANGEFWIELVDRVVKQGEQFTLGGRIDPETKAALIEVELAGTRDSKLSKFFQGMVGKRTYFGNLLENPSTFTLSTSLLLDEKQRKLYITYFESALKDLNGKNGAPESADLVKLIEPLVKNLILTSDVGHLDAVAQLTGVEQGQYALIAGAKLATSRSLPKEVADLLQHLHDNPNGNELLEKLEVSFDTIDTHPVHRIPINPPDDGGQRLFGESAYLYLYANPQSVWCSFGGDAGLDELKKALDSVAQPQDVTQSRNRIPFLFVTHARNWLTVADDDNADFNQRVNDSFQTENDTLKVEIRPTDSGVRMRIEFDSGYLSLMGRGFSKGIDEGRFNRPQDRQRDGARKERGAQPAPQQQDDDIP